MFIKTDYATNQTINIGSVQLSVHQGDITKETTEAIVNSTNKSLDLSQGNDTLFVIGDLNSDIGQGQSIVMMYVSHVGAVQKAIVHAAGNSIEQECRAIGRYTNHTTLIFQNVCDLIMCNAYNQNYNHTSIAKMLLLESLAGATTDGIAVTSAGQLPMKCIIHVALGDAVGDPPLSWQRVVKRVLIEAETRGLQSIAFPALGTGIQCLVWSVIDHSILS